MNRVCRYVRYALVLLLAPVLPGCAARSQTITTKAPRANLRSYSTLALAVHSALPEDLAKEKTALASHTLAQVKKRAKFKEARLAKARESAAGTLLMKATITKVKKISGSKRFWAGVFAGRANVTVDVKLIDAASGKELGSHTVTGESGGSGFAGGTEDAVKKAAEAMAALVG